MKILVADDNDAIRMGLCEFLERADPSYKCEGASNGDEALTKAEASKPDVVVLDMLMPGSKMFPELKMKLVALRLQVPDGIVRERAKTTGRESDRPQIIEAADQGLPSRDGRNFPNAKIVNLVGSLPEAKVWKAIQTALLRSGTQVSGEVTRSASGYLRRGVHQKQIHDVGVDCRDCIH